MEYDLEARRASLSVGELSEFVLGPREGGSGAAGIWRARLGAEWHRKLRAKAEAEAPGTEFEVPIAGVVLHRGWTLELSGRIDQLARPEGKLLVREIKSVLRPLPAEAADLRVEYPEYFAQAAAYAALLPQTPEGKSAEAAAELVFVDPSCGLVQVVPLEKEDEHRLRNQLDRVADFLDLRRITRERLRGLRFRPPFAQFRIGQAEALAALRAPDETAVARMLFEAPTGFGKTGVMLEFALERLREGRFERVIYLTSKATGQLQVARTLAAMTAPEASETPASGFGSAAAWLVRPKSEHCVNEVFHCVRETCVYLDGWTDRWGESGLSRFYLYPDQPRDLAAVREAARAVRICPYEVTRAALAFNDIWIGDYNYVFSPANRSLFHDQPGFDPARTLLIVDEAHNLPSRVADAHSQTFHANEARAADDALRTIDVPASLRLAWEAWARFLAELKPAPKLAPEDETDAEGQLQELAELISLQPLDYAALGPWLGERLREIPAWVQQGGAADLPRLWWCPREGELAIACLDPAPAIGAALRGFGGVILASATPGPADVFAAACGLDREAEPPEVPPGAAAESPAKLGALNRRETKALYRQLARGSDLLRSAEARASALISVVAPAPWREGAYRVACDLRVDTTFQHRASHRETTAAAVAALHRAAPSGGGAALAVFFPSYAYAEMILRALDEAGSPLRAVLQERRLDLAAQAAWVEDKLRSADTLFLVLGSSYTEGIDLLGGRIACAMVVGPALPEVNAVQRARSAALEPKLGRAEAFRRVYQVPGMQKVNQALGRLVRAPGQRARVLLHCRRFDLPDYAGLLAPEYRGATRLRDDAELAAWLAEDR